jgi:hypothetical protein
MSGKPATIAGCIDVYVNVNGKSTQPDLIGAFAKKLNTPQTHWRPPP